MNDDWLDTGEDQQVATLPVQVPLPADYAERVALATQCWQQLSETQQIFLNAIRDARLNLRKASRISGVSRSRHNEWMTIPAYSTVFSIWRVNASEDAVNKDRLLARQDDIVETLLEPKPILYQGEHTGFEEVQASSAAKANETLMRSAGLLKDKDIEINVGVSVGIPTLNIQVMPTTAVKKAAVEHVVIDAKFTEVPDDEWLGT